MYWQCLQVTFEIFCSDVAQIGSCFFLDQTRQINEPFGYMWTELIQQKDHLWCLWDILECHQKKLVKGKAWFIFYFCVLCSACRVEILFLSLFTVVLSSDNSFICFRRKAFLKSDMLAGFTTSVALIWYLTCVISWKFDFYSILFESGALHFPWQLAKWDICVPLSQGG